MPSRRAIRTPPKWLAKRYERFKRREWTKRTTRGPVNRCGPAVWQDCGSRIDWKARRCRRARSRAEIPGWAGSPQLKKENGSEPQPWHCPLFMEGATSGVELLFPYDADCHIINEGGQVRVEWGQARSPAAAAAERRHVVGPDAPGQLPVQHDRADLHPPGYVLRTQPHPRFFADRTGTAPAAVVYGHVQTHWWPKLLFVVFKIPGPGQRHVLRKGEPYVQLTFIPEDECDLAPMPAEEREGRRELERDIAVTRFVVGRSAWVSGSGISFNDHYKALARAYERDGMAGVEAQVRQGQERLKSLLPQSPQDMTVHTRAWRSRAATGTRGATGTPGMCFSN